jgi:SpoVK/Ycf46/Vps4 family AAA+-type ATPase
VTAAKRRVIRESGALEYSPADAGEADVGGLDLMKLWFHKREAGFSAAARETGLPFPRGVALIGIPGTGKSLSAKMLSGLWKLPLLRLDVGALFQSLLGESEQNLRKAIMLAETVSPCILWIDEMEKAFAGSGAQSINAGAATRVFGTFLTWMQEHRTPVFVIATANDVGALPPELMGRFDRTFFLDLPNETERREIFLIHLKNAGATFPERQFDLADLVRQSRGFVGREIERAVREAQFTAFADENRQIEPGDLSAAIEETVPLSESHQEIIEALRKWKTEGRAFPASSDEVSETGSGKRVIETM